MPIGHQNLEFLNHNSQRRYPIADDASLVDDTGSFRLPDDFIVELDLPIHAGLNVNPAGFYLQSVSAYAGGYGIVFGYQPAAGDPVTVATALIPRQGFTKNVTFSVGGIGDFEDTFGKIVIGRLENIDEQPPGFWEFSLANARLDPDAVRPIIRGVSSITCVNGSQRSVPLYGDIELVAGANMQIVPVIQEGADPIIKFNAISGEGTVQECVCEGDEAQPDPIKTILGVGPTTTGDFTIVGGACVQIEQIANGLRIVDVCSQPCCGCEELERITTDLARLSQQAATIENFVDRLRNAVDTMDLIVLGNKIGDRGCVTCE